MALMGLDIGGAETHVIELTKMLVADGHTVVVVSNGGVYEDTLKALGVKSYYAPLTKKSPSALLSSYRTIRRIIAEEKIDIVHSHARIPSSVCGLLHRRMHFPFLTSAHGLFYTGRGFKYLSDWGQKTIAVSKDIKDYLLNNYKILNRNIVLTINGIDTDSFSPTEKGEAVKAEFGLGTEPVIVHVSRLDPETELTAKLLISLAPDMDRLLPGFTLLIAGSGKSLPELQKLSETVNRKLGRACIRLAGRRTDIPRIVAVGDLVVGVSRAALEAMAAGKPVILSGSQGFMGLFDETKCLAAEENNFCGRGFSLPNRDNLFAAIRTAFCDLDAEQRKDLGLYGREVIKADYSLMRMKEDCVKAYDAVWNLAAGNVRRLLLSGYYGFRNAGDDAILASIVSSLPDRHDDIQLTVLSNRPQETRRLYDVEAVYRFHYPAIYRRLKKCDILVSGGGSLLQDRTSTRSLMYYLSLMAMAKRLGKKVMLYANGIGPVSKKGNRQRVKKQINRIDLITLREEKSKVELAQLGITTPPIYITADPVFTMEPPPKELIRGYLRQEGILCRRPRIGVSIRDWRGMDATIPSFAAYLDELSEKFNMDIIFIVMQHSHDFEISDKVRRLMKNSSYLLIGDYTPGEILGITGEMDYILSMRLHTLIFAAKQRIPMIGYVYDPKISFYLDQLGMLSAGEISNFDKDASVALFSELVEFRERYVEILDQRTRLLEENAKQNNEYLLALLENGLRL